MNVAIHVQRSAKNLYSPWCLWNPRPIELWAFKSGKQTQRAAPWGGIFMNNWLWHMCVFLRFCKSYLPARAAGRGITLVSYWCSGRLLLLTGIVCLLSLPLSLCVCLPTQPGISHPGSGPHGRRDAADWSQRVFPALPGVRLHHHPAGWHVSEPLCTHASLGAKCGYCTQWSICIYQTLIYMSK